MSPEFNYDDSTNDSANEFDDEFDCLKNHISLFNKYDQHKAYKNKIDKNVKRIGEELFPIA